MSYVEFKDVKKVYKTGEVEINALRDVDFEIEKGEFCVIVGSLRCGQDYYLEYPWRYGYSDKRQREAGWQREYQL